MVISVRTTLCGSRRHTLTGGRWTTSNHLNHSNNLNNTYNPYHSNGLNDSNNTNSPNDLSNPNNETSTGGRCRRRRRRRRRMPPPRCPFEATSATDVSPHTYSVTDVSPIHATKTYRVKQNIHLFIYVKMLNIRVFMTEMSENNWTLSNNNPKNNPKNNPNHNPKIPQ